jgi:hypothetical protein
MEGVATNATALIDSPRVAAGSSATGLRHLQIGICNARIGDLPGRSALQAAGCAPAASGVYD